MSEKKVIEILPESTLFFKGPQPFELGENSYANGIFPPYPSVFYGMLRSVYFADNLSELDKAETDNDPTKDLKITKIFFKDSLGNYYFPVPKDLVNYKSDSFEDEIKELHRLKLTKLDENIISSYPKDLTYLLVNEGDEIIEEAEGLISLNTLSNYISNNEGNLESIPWNHFFEIEHKVGISINKATGTASDGKLYRLAMNRVKDFSFVIEYEGLEITIDNRVVKIGAENKTAICREVTLPDDLIPSISLKNNDNEKVIFKLYFVTPAYFKNGWKPSFPNLELLTAVFKKPVSIGGWDLKKKEPKPLYSYIPAGSVYYFSCSKDSFESLVKEFHGKCICEKKSKEGFGLVFMNLVNEGMKI